MHFTVKYIHHFQHFSKEFCVGLSLRRCERQNVLLGHTRIATSQRSQLPGTVTKCHQITKVLGGTKSSEPCNVRMRSARRTSWHNVHLRLPQNSLISCDFCNDQGMIVQCLKVLTNVLLGCGLWRHFSLLLKIQGKKRTPMQNIVTKITNNFFGFACVVFSNRWTRIIGCLIIFESQAASHVTTKGNRLAVTVESTVENVVFLEMTKQSVRLTPRNCNVILAAIECH
jgi:hypothetical protein